MRRSLKYILIFIATILLLLISLLLLTQTSYFREKVKTKVIGVVENHLHLKLEIEKIEGNWYNSVGAKNVIFRDKNSIVAEFSSLKINYHLLPLTRKLIEIDSIVIANPQINLWQKKDSTWNLNSYIKTSTKPKPKKKRQFNFDINVEGIAIKNGSVSISSLSEFIPNEIAGLNLFANGAYNKNETRIALDKLEFSAIDPSITLKNLSGIYTSNQKGIQIDSLLLITGNSNIDSYASYVSTKNLNATIDASRIDNKELEVFIPEFKLLCSPSVYASLKTINDSVSAQIELTYENESILADLSFDRFSNLLEKTGDIPYLSTITITNFNVANWIESNNQKSLIEGQIQLNGTNLLDFNSQANVKAHLTNSHYKEFIIDTLDLEAAYEKDSISADVIISSQYGDATISGNLVDIDETPKYKANINCHNINLSTLIPKLIGTNINGEIQVWGEGFNSEEILAHARVNLINSSVYTFPLDTLQANLSFNSSDLIIDSLQLHVPGAVLNGNGNLSLDSLYLETQVYADIASLEVIDSLVELPIKFDSVTTITNITGPVRFLQIGGDVDVFNAEGYSSKVERANAKYLVEILEDSLNVHVNTTALNVETGPAEWDSTTIDLNYAESKVDIIAHVNWFDTLSANIETSITTNDTMSVVVPKFEVNTLLSNFYMPDTMTAHIYAKDKLELENLVLKDRNNETFVFGINGTVSNDKPIDFEILVNEFNLSKLNGFINKQDSLKGIFETKIAIGGNPTNPSLNGELHIKNPEFGEYALSSLKSHFEYNNQEGSIELTTPDWGESLYATMNAKFEAYFDSLNFIFNPPETFAGSLELDSVDISKTFAAFVPNDSIKGILHGTIDASGEWESPLLDGKINITDAQYINKNLGVEYNDIKTSLAFDGNKIILDTVVVRQKNGLISVSGEVEFDSTIISGNIKSSSLQVDADRFFLTQHRNYEILIDANTFIKTNNQKPEYGGKIRVIRSDVYLPALVPDNKTDIETDIPLLIEALQDPSDTVDTSGISELSNVKRERNKNAFTEKLTGRLNVEIPRNTWVKSDDMRAELSGDLEIVKTGPYFEIFGNIDVTRGHYILYGRKLNIQESQVIFQGGEELDPMLDIKAEYIYRGSDKEKRYLELLVNGNMSEPDITFLLDGSEISETDGISILIFGVTSDEIGYGGQNGLINSVGSNAVASVITSQLSRTIGTQLKLDMIEITATDNWQSAAFVVGKYVTNDIFVIYERGFGEVDGDEITPETITIEYELNDKLFLRLMSGSSRESGVDIILKFEEDNRLMRKKNPKTK